ncbi:MAG: hypothetical protein K2M87_07940, partial [Muribaculaceae bacterium]|nr:hypothetical protein [Muribaculaceae bacterium]
MKKLLYHTLGYPSDLYTERSFALPEIKALRSVYDEIIIIPTSDFGNKFGYEKELPEGVKVDWTIARDSIVHSRMMRLPYLAHPFVIRTLVEMCGEARTPGQFGSGFLSAATTVRVASLLEKITLRHSMTRDNTTLYSLWMAGAFNGMARFAMRHKQRLFARAHGFDIRKEPDNFRSDRMRKRLLYGVDKVFMIADGARCKMEELFPEHADRFETIRLGSSRLFSPHSLNLDSDTIRIVTSARFVRLKRLPETLEILGEATDMIPDRKIEW